MPDVTLRSYRGGTVSLRAERGKVVLLSFLDSQCTQSCPIIAALVGQVWRMLSRAERAQVRAYAISVNPLVDTPANVRTFLADRHALTALDWLIVSVNRMRPIWKAFGVLPAIDTGSNDIHSAGVRLFDLRGYWVSNLHVGVDLTPANLVHDLRRALNASA